MTKTTTEAHLRKLAASGKTAKQIAEAIGRPPAAVAATLSVLGIKTHGWGGGPKCWIDPDKGLKLLSSGMSLSQAAKEMGCTKMGLYMALRRVGLPTTHLEILRLING